MHDGPRIGLRRDFLLDVKGMAKNPLIEFLNVTKRFGENTVLDRVNLKIYENEITTIIGKSGTGKTVL